MPPLNKFNRTLIAVAISHAALSGSNAATIQVTSNADDGTDCTLREAIVSLNLGSLQAGCVLESGAFGTNDAVTFGTLAFPTITLTGGQISIAQNKAISIDAQDTNITVSGDVASRIFYVRSAALDLNNVTLTNGSAVGGGGAILARNQSTVALSNSKVSFSSANYGGGIYASNSTVSLDNSSVEFNNSPYFGGGIYLNTAELNVNQSLVSSNVAQQGGGTYANNAVVHLYNSTVSGNSATDSGAGIYAKNTSAVQLINATISNNTAASSGGGILSKTTASISLANTLVAGNVAAAGSEINDYDATSVFVVDNNNLFGSANVSSAGAFNNFAPGATDIDATSSGDNVALAAILNALANNGGSTNTHALPALSPAIDAGNNSLCVAAPISNVDQRNQPRDANCDIGAFENQDSLRTIIRVDSNLDDGNNCTLRDAIVSVNTGSLQTGCTLAQGVLGDEALIEFMALNSPTIVLSGVQLTVAPTKEVTIEGGDAGIAIDANSLSRVFYVNDSTLSLNEITVTGGASDQGGGIRVYGDGSLTLKNTQVVGNSASVIGGGVSFAGNYLSIIESTIANNSSGNSGGGLSTVASAREAINIVDTVISGNSAPLTGGGITANSSLSLNLLRSTVSGNSATFGGGIATDNYVNLDIDSSAITSNAGSGMRLYRVTLNMRNSTVSDNTGNGVSFNTGASATIINTTIASNTDFGIFAGSSTVTFKNSIVTGNQTNEVANVFNTSTMVANANNLFGESSKASAGLSFTPGVNDIDASQAGLNVPLSSILSPLANNGGTTLSNALVARSPAIDAGDSAVCSANMIVLDQRGIERDARCDIGAYEYVDSTDFFIVPLKNGKQVIFGL